MRKETKFYVLATHRSPSAFMQHSNPLLFTVTILFMITTKRSGSATIKKRTWNKSGDSKKKERSDTHRTYNELGQVGEKFLFVSFYGFCFGHCFLCGLRYFVFHSTRYFVFESIVGFCWKEYNMTDKYVSCCAFCIDTFFL